ncbi:unnamed protein product [Amoebophrya sp. A25]|nr:unnamed protein product [Amoebophrya sp. A25]|eukprot:GSA25T00005487001.1
MMLLEPLDKMDQERLQDPQDQTGLRQSGFLSSAKGRLMQESFSFVPNSTPAGAASSSSTDSAGGIGKTDFGSADLGTVTVTSAGEMPFNYRVGQSFLTKTHFVPVGASQQEVSSQGTKTDPVVASQQVSLGSLDKGGDDTLAVDIKGFLPQEGSEISGGSMGALKSLYGGGENVGKLNPAAEHGTTEVHDALKNWGHENIVGGLVGGRTDHEVKNAKLSEFGLPSTAMDNEESTAGEDGTPDDTDIKDSESQWSQVVYEAGTNEGAQKLAGAAAGDLSGVINHPEGLLSGGASTEAPDSESSRLEEYPAGSPSDHSRSQSPSPGALAEDSQNRKWLEDFHQELLDEHARKNGGAVQGKVDSDPLEAGQDEGVLDSKGNDNVSKLLADVLANMGEAGDRTDDSTPVGDSLDALPLSSANSGHASLKGQATTEPRDEHLTPATHGHRVPQAETVEEPNPAVKGHAASSGVLLDGSSASAESGGPGPSADAAGEGSQAGALGSWHGDANGVSKGQEPTKAEPVEEAPKAVAPAEEVPNKEAAQVEEAPVASTEETSTEGVMVQEGVQMAPPVGGVPDGRGSSGVPADAAAHSATPSAAGGGYQAGMQPAAGGRAGPPTGSDVPASSGADAALADGAKEAAALLEEAFDPRKDDEAMFDLLTDRGMASTPSSARLAFDPRKDDKEKPVEAAAPVEEQPAADSAAPAHEMSKVAQVDVGKPVVEAAPTAGAMIQADPAVAGQSVPHASTPTSASRGSPANAAAHAATPSAAGGGYQAGSASAAGGPSGAGMQGGGAGPHTQSGASVPGGAAFTEGDAGGHASASRQDHQTIATKTQSAAPGESAPACAGGTFCFMTR